MSKGDILKKVASIVSKNTGLAAVDSIAFGMGSALKNSADEIAAYTKLTNEALYYMQVKTFLETADLDQEEVNQFFDSNKDNQRLGAEIFKILEQTYIEKQSQMMARAFTLYVLGEIDKTRLDQLVYIVTNLNQHLINRLEGYFPDNAIINKAFNLDYEALGGGELFRNNDDYTKEDISYDRKIWGFFSTEETDVPQEFVNWGFYQAIDVDLTMDLEKLPKQKYRPTKFFLWFVTIIMKGNKIEKQCTQ